MLVSRRLYLHFTSSNLDSALNLRLSNKASRKTPASSTMIFRVTLGNCLISAGGTAGHNATGSDNGTKKRQGNMLSVGAT